jgi:enamine deaminase RidA (YjgF/YER057c/UK114 family)
MNNASARLAELGFQLPPVPRPVGGYVPAVRYGRVIRTTGQLPFEQGRLVAVGTLGTDIDVATGARAARIAALNALAAAAELAGGLDRIERALGLVVYIACGSEFREHPAVADGASLLLTDVLGEAGRHVRSNVGCSALPLASPVEVELTMETAV